VRVIARDLTLESRGDEHVDVHREELAVSRPARRRRGPQRRRRIAGGVLDRSRDVDASAHVAAVTSSATMRIREREGLRGDAADVAEARGRRGSRGPSLRRRTPEWTNRTPRPSPRATLEPRGRPVSRHDLAMLGRLSSSPWSHITPSFSVVFVGCRDSCSARMIGRIAGYTLVSRWTRVESFRGLTRPPSPASRQVGYAHLKSSASRGLDLSSSPLGENGSPFPGPRPGGVLDAVAGEDLENGRRPSLTGNATMSVLSGC